MTTPSHVVLMKRLWLKALHEGEVTLTLSNPQEAVRLRFALYNAIRGARKGHETDQELVRAAGDVQLLYSKGEVTVTLRKRSFDPMLKAAAAALGIPEGEEVSPEPTPTSAEALALAESLRKVQESLDKPVEHRPTPYYNRGEE